MTCHLLPDACAIEHQHDRDCPGPGKCHGCMAWCDCCGDVGDVCHYRGCMQHWCMSCKELLGPDDAYSFGSTPAWCWTCALAAMNDDVRERFERAAGMYVDSIFRIDLNLAAAHARDLLANPVPDLAWDTIRYLFDRRYL